MRKIYQADWQRIAFTDLATLSSTELPSANFYAAFYREFFHRYQRWEDLESTWRQSKDDCAAFILGRAPRPATMLSVGCGLGFVEHCIHRRDRSVSLFIQDFAPGAWKWIEAEIPEDHKLVGNLPACLPNGVQFDVVYLSAVDYALDDESLIDLLKSLRSTLRADGQLIIVSASFDPTAVSLADRMSSAWTVSKGLVASALDRCSLRPRGQLWGWSRSRNEYQAIMNGAGFGTVEDGFFGGSTAFSGTYWIAGIATDQGS